jgi:sugar lactone lactonase YvrE
MQLEMIADYECLLGEGPLWNPFEASLYWTDIRAGRMFRFDPETGEHEEVYRGDPVGGFTIQADGGLLFFMDNGAVRSWHGGRLSTLVEEIPEERGGRFNDVIADSRGRVLCGTVHEERGWGSLYRLDRNAEYTKLLEPVECSNGMGFSGDDRTLYFTDSGKGTIDCFDYQAEDGSIDRRRPFAAVRNAKGEGIPDGMTVDAEDCVWSACWGGKCIVRYSPQGDELTRIKLPAVRVSSLTFGGEDYADLYVTTAGGGDRKQFGEGAGAVFRVRPGVAGRPEFLSRIGL